MKRRQFLIQGLATTAAIGTNPTNLLAYPSLNQNKKLVILHTNDMHSHIDPFDIGRNKGFGGMSCRASIIKQIREQENHVLLLDCGDVFQGTPYFNMFGGELELKLMSTMKYDATTIGNHEFDNGIARFKQAMNYAEFPYINSNYDLSRTILRDSVRSYQVFKKGKFKVGVFGLGIRLDGLVNASLYGNTKYQDPYAVAKEMVQELKSQGCNLIVCLSHLGYDYGEKEYPCDTSLAREVSEIDIILGGHTHTFMDKPQVITNHEGYQTTINQVGWAGINLGRIDVLLTKRGSQMSANKAIKIS